MDDRQHKPPADDPSFLTSLSELDRGLDGSVEESRPPVRSPTSPPQRAAPGRRAEPVGAFPSAVAPPPTRSEPEAPLTHGPGERRPLLDLFPPPPSPRERVPAPSIGGAHAPRLERTRPARSLAPVASAPALTYETFYGLNENPFGPSSELKFLYRSTSHDSAAQELRDAIGRRDGFVVLTGQLGVGKTTLCRAVMGEFDRRTLTAFVSDPFLTVDELLRTVLVQFGVISREDLARGRLMAASAERLTAALEDFVASLAGLQASAIVIIDDAQNVPVHVLGQIGSLVGTERGPRRLQVVLVGERKLLKLLKRHELRRLGQQIAVRIELRPLTPDDIVGYVMHRVQVAGSSARIEFHGRAFGALFGLSAGVPRAINLLCDRALMLGYRASASVIDEALVRGAAESLDFAPAVNHTGSIVRRISAALAFVLLMAVGAGAAAWVFRDQVVRILAQWAGVPLPPAAPSLRLPTPLIPAAPPEAPAEVPVK